MTATQLNNVYIHVIIYNRDVFPVVPFVSIFHIPWNIYISSSAFYKFGTLPGAQKL